MLYEKKNFAIGKSRFGEKIMILYTTVNLVKLMESSKEHEEDEMTRQILELTLNELFRSVLILDDGLWN